MSLSIIHLNSIFSINWNYYVIQAVKSTSVLKIKSCDISTDVRASFRKEFDPARSFNSRWLITFLMAAEQKLRSKWWNVKANMKRCIRSSEMWEKCDIPGYMFEFMGCKALKSHSEQTPCWLTCSSPAAGGVWYFHFGFLNKYDILFGVCAELSNLWSFTGIGMR